MFGSSEWPYWFQILRLLLAFWLTAGFGIHAFYRHKQQKYDATSPRRWMYWIYSMVFLLAGTANFCQFLITLVFQDYQKASFHLGYSTLVLVLSYAALLAGDRRGVSGKPLP